MGDQPLPPSAQAKLTPAPAPHRRKVQSLCPERSSSCTHIWGPSQTGGILPLTLQQDLPIQAGQVLACKSTRGGEKGHRGGEDERKRSRVLNSSRVKWLTHHLVNECGDQTQDHRDNP